MTPVFGCHFIGTCKTGGLRLKKAGVLVVMEEAKISKVDASFFHFTKEANFMIKREKEFCKALSWGLSLCFALLFLMFLPFLGSLFLS